MRTGLGRGLSFVAMACAMAGCDASGLTTAYQLRNVDPALTDAEALRVAVVTRADVRPIRRRVYLTAQLTPEIGAASTYRFALVPVGHGPAGKDQALLAKYGTVSD